MSLEWKLAQTNWNIMPLEKGIAYRCELKVNEEALQLNQVKVVLKFYLL